MLWLIQGSLAFRFYQLVTRFAMSRNRLHPEDAMKLPRRTFLRLAVGAAALPMVPRIAKAQTYPGRPVRILVGFPAGGPFDTTARLLGQWLSERLGEPFVV